MDKRPKSNYAQIISAIVAVLALLFGQNICSRQNKDAMPITTEKSYHFNNPKASENDTLIYGKIFVESVHDITGPTNEIEENVTQRIYDLIEARQFSLAMHFIDSIIKYTDGDRLFKFSLFKKKSEIEIQITYGGDIVSWNEDSQVYIFVKNLKFGIVNKNKKMVVNPIFDDILPVNNNLFAVDKQDKWGFIDSVGKVKLDYFFDGVFDSYLPFVVVSKGNKIGLVNSQGKLIANPNNDNIEIEDKYIVLQRNHKYGIIDSIGRNVLDLKYPMITLNENGEISVFDREMEYYLDKTTGKLKPK
ncbi:MAG TPA: WG repeat-containing protein [Saprospiraceae bacterium]|nr:WG repeat-containing protein [Saprospiraceae bacterium]